MQPLLNTEPRFLGGGGLQVFTLALVSGTWGQMQILCVCMPDPAERMCNRGEQHTHAVSCSNVPFKPGTIWYDMANKVKVHWPVRERDGER